MRVPQQPTAFHSGKRTYLVYELHLTNFSGVPITLSKMEILDADAPAAKPVAVFSSTALETMLQPIANPQPGSDARHISPGGTAVLYVWIELDSEATVPKRLSHRAMLANATVEGAIVSTHATPLHVLMPPLAGAHWLASDGPGNGPDNHHRRGLVVVDGRAVISRRFAIDWMKSQDGATFTGGFGDVHSHFAYGQPVMAVAKATVLAALDGLPDNVPGHEEAFRPAVPINRDTVQGNTVTLDLGGGQYAYYLHLAPGSVRVKVGDHVRAGQVIARVGASGDAREPHLHFEVTDSPIPLAGEGLPYAIGSYGVETAQGIKAERDALPLNNMIVDFSRRSVN
jgi:murein DD-endopeptidase MepM/ murein hydrolase activator NlpD